MGIFENCPGCGELIASWGHTCGAWPSPSNLPAQPTASPRREDAAGRVARIREQAAGSDYYVSWVRDDVNVLLAALSTAEREREALRDAAKSLLMLLDEWAWTAHHTVQSPGIKATVAQSDMVQRRTKLWELVARVPSGRTPEDGP